MSSPAVTTRQGGIPRNRTLGDLDIEILRMATRFAMVRPWHFAAWTGASPHTIAAKLRTLAQTGLMESWSTDITLTERDGTLVQTRCTVWAPTNAGADLAGQWEVPGTGQKVSMGKPRVSRMMSHHVLGVVDLACWYRHYGFAVAAEREIISERPTPLRVNEPQQYWSTTLTGRKGIHPPDLGAVHPSGTMWAVEAERAVKSVDEYADVIEAYMREGRGQVWHVQAQATATRLMRAARKLGITWQPQGAVRGVTVSTDGLVRFQGWKPGRAGLSRPNQWRGQIPRTSPAGIDVPTPLPDLTAGWKGRRVIDAEEAIHVEGGVFW